MAIPFASYRLSRAALDQRQFLAIELAALTGVPLNTVYSFINDLGTRVTSEPQASGNVGRRQKLYTLTEEGVDYLLDRNFELARLLKLGREMEPLGERLSVHDHPSVAEGTLREVLSELQGIYSTERKCIDRLPSFGKGPVSEMKATLEAHIRMTKGHINRLKQLLEAASEPDRAEVKQAETYQPTQRAVAATQDL
jgi:hypothetical protein